MYSVLQGNELFNRFAEVTLLNCLKEFVSGWYSSPNAWGPVLPQISHQLHVTEVQLDSLLQPFGVFIFQVLSNPS